ncbi:hypothetical protein ACFV97_25530 [Streptomyces sp. NPDC059913]|uniref:hypothetical protein n=1 Tax=unclassified Streptomyces TaxID=2593676 RepID=UPI0036611E80
MSLVPQPDFWAYEGERRVGRYLSGLAPEPLADVQPEPYVQLPDSGVSVRAVTDALQAAPDIERFTEVFDHATDDAHGAFAQMHNFLESAATWCQERGARDSADQLGAWALRLEKLIEDVRVFSESLAIEAGWRYLDTTQAALRPSPHASASRPTAARPDSARTVPPALNSAVRHR